MPELPEVETIVRGLDRLLRGKTIASATVMMAKIVSPEPPRFEEALRGEQIASVGRRGKMVVVELTSRRCLLVHLRMTGRLIVQEACARDPEPYTKVLLRYTDDSRLCFADIRQFGRMRLVEPEDKWASDVGIEPLSEEFSVEWLATLLRGRTTPIKVFLLDQRHVAGLGNIYACEALWEAGIPPSRPAGSISREGRQHLHAAIRDVLERAITLRGTSIDDYVDAEGAKGGFQNQLKVYGRDGQPCLRCGRMVQRIVLAQRGTWWCPGCQKV
jgi:formamidopyrimidine-DNA glycosylase